MLLILTLELLNWPVNQEESESTEFSEVPDFALMVSLLTALNSSSDPDTDKVSNWLSSCSVFAMLCLCLVV